jgi:methylenetetrahydrofolate dehydrogenase (NADP+) / methenyltetrahydrofolate cyclohydrolase
MMRGELAEERRVSRAMMNVPPERSKGVRLTARILNGNAIRGQIYAELTDKIEALARAGVRPGLAAVLVGENSASKLYVNSKIAACGKLGLTSFLLTPPASITTAGLLAVVAELNRRDDVDGILVQMPLPRQVEAKQILDAIDPAKDVDGFHPINVGKLVAGRPNLVACTPAGVMEILRRSNIAIEGANAVVIGRSDIVGKPMAILLMHANATVTICHSKTRDLKETVRRADIVVAAMGRAAMVTPDYIRPGATVIDVGQNVVTDAAEAERIVVNFPEKLDAFRAKGSILVGDVHPDVVNTAGALTPVPGGVGPLTIAMLMSNTVKAARMRRGVRTPVATASQR